MNNLTITNQTNTSLFESLQIQHDMTWTYYSILIAGTVIFGLTSSIAFFYFTSSASIVLHNNTFNKIMRATMEFFDLHLTGNILNRFAKDIGLIDEYLPYVYFEVIRVNNWCKVVVECLIFILFSGILYTVWNYGNNRFSSLYFYHLFRCIRSDTLYSEVLLFTSVKKLKTFGWSK